MISYIIYKTGHFHYDILHLSNLPVLKSCYIIIFYFFIKASYKTSKVLAISDTPCNTLTHLPTALKVSVLRTESLHGHRLFHERCFRGVPIVDRRTD